MRNFLTLKPELFGLDISDSSLKIIKLKKKRKGLGLVSFGEQRIKPGIIKSGEIMDEEGLISSLKEVLSKVKGEKLNTRNVICSLPEEQGFLQVIKMPKIKKEELKNAVRYEAENYIPFPIDEVYLDSKIVPSVYGHSDKLNILIIAFPQKIIDAYVFCLKKAGLQPTVLELESSATARALIKNEVSPCSVLLIDLGMMKSNFMIFSGYSLRFTSSIPVFSHGFTQVIAKNLNINPEEAEKLKIKYGLKMKKSEGKKVFESLVPVLTDFAEQIKKRLDFYQTHFTHEHLLPEGKGIKKIILCGGGANLEGLTEFLSSHLKMTVELGNPWINIMPERQKEKSQLSSEQSLRYATALGLAIRGVNFDKIEF